MASLTSPYLHRLSLRSLLARAVVMLFAAFTVVFAASPSDAQYRIRTGDRLQIEVLEDPSLNRTVLVVPDGTISFPLIGSVKAQGRGVNDVRQDLAAGLAPNFAAAPTVSVAVATLADTVSVTAKDATIDIFVMGEVLSPGKKEVEPGITLLQFLAEAGGVTPFAAKSRIELHRVSPNGETQVYLYSYNGRGKGPHIASSTPLGSGDVVIVPTRKLFE